MTKPKTLEQLVVEWPKLLDMEEEAFQKCCELDNAGNAGTAEKKEAVRLWWKIVNGVLWMFTRTRAQYDHELQPFPVFMLGRLANISEEIGNGNIPRFVSDARKGGRSMWRAERHHIAYGVAYIEAANRGEIEDDTPNKTVRQAYNVTAKAVQGWCKRSEEICVGVPLKHLTPQRLQTKMLESAAIYSRFGRGAPSEN